MLQGSQIHRLFSDNIGLSKLSVGRIKGFTKEMLRCVMSIEKPQYKNTCQPVVMKVVLFLSFLIKVFISLPSTLNPSGVFVIGTVLSLVWCIIHTCGFSKVSYPFFFLYVSYLCFSHLRNSIKVFTSLPSTLNPSGVLVIGLVLSLVWCITHTLGFSKGVLFSDFQWGMLCSDSMILLLLVDYRNRWKNAQHVVEQTNKWKWHQIYDGRKKIIGVEMKDRILTPLMWCITQNLGFSKGTVLNIPVSFFVVLNSLILQLFFQFPHSPPIWPNYLLLHVFISVTFLLLFSLSFSNEMNTSFLENASNNLPFSLNFILLFQRGLGSKTCLATSPQPCLNFSEISAVAQEPQPSSQWNLEVNIDLNLTQQLSSRLMPILLSLLQSTLSRKSQANTFKKSCVSDFFLSIFVSSSFFLIASWLLPYPRLHFFKLPCLQFLYQYFTLWYALFSDSFFLSCFMINSLSLTFFLFYMPIYF
ncbi:hypothetical protein VP01_320g3 [Puccinia sorghi]|uniref:Uncharacterized protein n=1 Tax=Puccinia sorghi TaxID=27349 RepID=A0A0L6UYG5_9BASI|nr:hypothetical protein VP01_320g3 [Puccinia sorghi]